MNGMNSVINIAGAHKYRKRFTSEQRLMITKESTLPENSVSATARKYSIHPTLLKYSYYKNNTRNSYRNFFVHSKFFIFLFIILSIISCNQNESKKEYDN